MSARAALSSRSSLRFSYLLYLLYYLSRPSPNPVINISLSRPSCRHNHTAYSPNKQYIAVDQEEDDEEEEDETAENEEDEEETDDEKADAASDDDADDGKAQKQEAEAEARAWTSTQRLVFWLWAMSGED
jgi:thiol:disulfide interchange protein